MLYAFKFLPNKYISKLSRYLFILARWYGQKNGTTKVEKRAIDGKITKIHGQELMLRWSLKKLTKNILKLTDMEVVSR